ncbi:DUF3558 domain-containing protein [Nocardia sp. NPDC052112]|uniref:DUF3558 domain-containing protein n=1 Tax=Nocardia sp. NPDC052112 TaxID=3155646 RepID=UPI0034359F40
MASATTLVACAGSSTDQGANTVVSATASPATSAKATASVKVGVPPAPVQTGAKQVRFDPCVSVGDDLVTRAGFDPATRERYPGESVSILTTIGCQFWRETLVDGEKYPTGMVSVTSSDSTLDDIRNNPDYHSVFNSDPIGGREAVLYRTPLVDGLCSASLKSSDGTFTVGLHVHPGPVAVPPACDQIRQIAETFSEALGTD